MNTIAHFELPAADTQRALGFWGGLLGWKFQSWEDGQVEYHMIEGGEPGGAIYPSDDAGSGPIVYFPSEDIDASMAKVRELGGTADHKHPIPTVGWYSHCKDTEGNRFGLFQSDESVEAPAG
jgi:predicted enzyme related to lactoylglutathione lyase